MIDFSGPESLASSIEDAPRAASAIADAEGARACAVIPLMRRGKLVAKQPTSTPEITFATTTTPRTIQEVRGVALKRISEALVTLAGMKNVPIADDTVEDTAALILDQMTFGQAYQLAGFEKDGVFAAVQAVNAHLDVVIMARVMWLLADARATDVRDPAVVATTQDIFARFEAGLDDKRCIRWPDPSEMIQQHCELLQSESADA